MKKKRVGKEELYWLRVRLAQGSQCDAAPQISAIFLNAVDAQQAVPSLQSLKIAADATVTGAEPIVGESARFNFVLNAESTITQLDFLADTAEQPQVRVLEYKAPHAATNEPGQLTTEAVWLGWGEGRPGQRLMLPGAPIVADAVSLYTIEKIEEPPERYVWRRWTRRTDLDGWRGTSRRAFPFGWQ
jgi:hypothetical protein